MEKKPKLVEKPKPECCLTCKYLFRCAETAGAKCRKYVRREIDKEAISTRYLEILKRLTDLTNELVIIETEMQIAEKIGIAPKEPEEHPPISRRNKQIVKLVDQGLTEEEIAQKLNLKPETVKKELNYLIKIGVLKAIKATNKLNGKKATLIQNGKKVVVIPA